ncbi:hypothetical protein [Paenibacillus gyeongsangnamensis]|nr:hypothetical protein [Paenibacillus filicis]
MNEQQIFIQRANGLHVGFGDSILFLREGIHGQHVRQGFQTKRGAYRN